jgi:hypothetical protein
VVTNRSVGRWINDPTGCLWRTRTFENKHEEAGGVNWKLLPAGIGSEWVGLLRGAARAAARKAKMASPITRWASNARTAERALLFFPLPKECILVAPN